MSTVAQKPIGTIKPQNENLKTTTSPKVVELNHKEDLKPLEDRVLRINQLWQLQGKHTRLNESLVRLKKFLVEVDKETITISVKNGDYRSNE